MTDQEIAERVARECFGWEVSSDGTYWRGQELPLTRPGLWAPCTDAGDAERVKQYLLKLTGEVHVWTDGNGCHVKTGAPVDTHDGVCDPDEGRALCLAALVAAY